MIAIFKKEMKLYFTTATGYIFLAVALLASGFILAINTYLMSEPSSNTTGYFSFILIMMMVFLPILTMRSFSDEKRTKTDQLLFTAPVPVVSLVIGFIVFYKRMQNFTEFSSFASVTSHGFWNIKRARRSEK